MFLVSANGTNFALNGKMQLPGGSKGITPPVIANGKMYIRSDSLLCCYDISVNSEAGPQSGAAATGKPSTSPRPFIKPTPQKPEPKMTSPAKPKAQPAPKADAVEGPEEDEDVPAFKTPSVKKPAADIDDPDVGAKPKRKLPGMP